MSKNSKNTKVSKSIENQVKAEVERFDKEADVLYQRLGGRWYAFSIVDQEIYFGSVPQELSGVEEIPNER